MEKLIGQYVEMLNDRHPQQNGANAGPPNGCPAFAQIKPAKINLSLFGRLDGEFGEVTVAACGIGVACCGCRCQRVAADALQ